MLFFPKTVLTFRLSSHFPRSGTGVTDILEDITFLALQDFFFFSKRTGLSYRPNQKM